MNTLFNIFPLVFSDHSIHRTFMHSLYTFSWLLNFYDYSVKLIYLLTLIIFSDAVHRNNYNAEQTYFLKKILCSAVFLFWKYIVSFYWSFVILHVSMSGNNFLPWYYLLSNLLYIHIWYYKQTTRNHNKNNTFTIVERCSFLIFTKYIDCKWRRLQKRPNLCYLR